MNHRMTRVPRLRAIPTLVALVLLALPSKALPAQADVTCVPVAERAGRELGCFITAREELGRLAASPALYWHLDTFPSREAALAARDAARLAAQHARATVVESLGKVWLFTIAPAEWRSRGGARVSRIGPLPLFAADSFAAVYMEGVFAPGMRTAAHRHPGVEAWFTLEGSMCLETPAGKLEQHAGDAGVFVAGGVPMQLTGTGNAPRRSVVLILQDATQPRSTPAHDWTPRGLCASPAGS
ncbi:MAG TPA: hypothetical protein VHM30_11075 [Gemmatimonadaceae bacterium]|nr:hypothetical protein [Gemmatimonadaceae bacterium]